ncbi:MAG: twin-arginine translocation signal domain-containing protein [Edaphobacter sp.]
MINPKTSRRQFLTASGIVAAQTAVSGLSAAAAPFNHLPQPVPPHGVITKQYNFAEGSAGWLPCYTDYNIAQPDYQLLAEVRPLPRELWVPGWNRNAFYIQGNNHSDSLFMFLKTAVTVSDGVQPDTPYLLSFDIWFASDSGSGCPGAGGSPDAVWLKAGGSTVEPVPVLVNDDVFFNIDKGDQDLGGKNLGVIGSINNGTRCPTREWVMLHKTYNHPFAIRSNRNAPTQLWIAIGTDSGYESFTGLYYYSIDVKLTPVASCDC